MIRKTCLYIIFWGTCSAVFAQTLEEKPTLLPITPFSRGAFYWGDYDRDGDLDLLLYAGSSERFMLLRNDASVFTEVSTPLPTTLSNGKASWTDYDLDGYLDMIVSSHDPLIGDPETRVFHNDRDGTFSEQTPPALAGSTISTTLQLVDIDHDGDEDLYMPGDYNESKSNIFFNQASVFEKNEIQLTAYDNASAWTDYNHDGRVDVAIARSSFGSSLVIYKNQGEGVFEQISSGLPGSVNGKLVWIDFDMDGDEDLCVMGTSGAAPLFMLAINEDGNFSEFHIDLPALHRGDFSWGDVNNDGYPDVLLSGLDAEGNPVTDLYLNVTGTGFEVYDGVFPQVWNGCVEIIDIDRDGDSDLFLAGFDNTTNVLKVYMNKLVENGGAQNANPAVPTNLTLEQNDAVRLQWARSADDLTSTAAIAYNVQIRKGTQLMTNSKTLANGTLLQNVPGNAYTNNFYVIHDLPAGTYSWTVQAIDPDRHASSFASTMSFTLFHGPHNLAYTQPDYKTVLLTWTDTLASETGFQIYRRTENTGFEVVATVPANTTSYEDADLTTNTYYYQVKALYATVASSASNEVSVAVSGFSQADIPSLSNLAGATLTWADVDDDHDLDAFAVNSTAQLRVYLNEGNLSFKAGQIVDDAVFDGPLLARDFDADGDIDVVAVVGDGPLNLACYRNDGGTLVYVGTLLVQASAIIELKDIAFDHDGQVDLLISIEDPSANVTCAIWRNMGDFVFENSGIDPSQNGQYKGTPRLVDFNQDSFVDVLWTGTNSSDRALVFNNQGEGFTASDITLPTMNSWTDFFDYDGDGDLDLVITGSAITLYQNTGGVFTLTNMLSLGNNTGTTGYQYHFIDFNNDGRRDIFFAGWYPLLYLNNGNGTFRLDSYTFPFYDDVQAEMHYYVDDWDVDGDMDIIFSGTYDVVERTTLVYENQVVSNGKILQNEPPVVPQGLNILVESPFITLEWDKSIDDQSPSAEISYNTRVEYEGVLTHSAETDETGQYHKISRQHEAMFPNKFTWPLMASGNYRAQVQALDAAYAPSQFSTWIEWYVPYGPYNLTAIHTPFNIVNLSWTDTLAHETAFVIERRKSDGVYAVMATVPAGTTSYDDVLTTYNDLYYYRVNAIQQGTPSPYSNEVMVVTERPAPPMVTDTTIYACAGPNYTLTVPGEQVQWYESTNLVTPVHTGETYQANLDETTTLYVTHEVEGITSYAASLTVTLEGTLPAPAGAIYFFCEDEVIPPLQVEGSDIRWYLDAGRSQLIAHGSTYQPINTGADKLYYVTQSAGACESSTATIKVDIQQINVVLHREENRLIVSQENADSYYWYRDGELVTISYGINYLDLTMPGEYTVQVFNGDCSKASTAFLIDDIYITALEDDVEGAWAFYPNPVASVLTVTSPRLGLQDVVVKWVKENGQELPQQSMRGDADGKIQINVQSMSAATYTLLILVDKVWYAERIIVH